MGEMDLMSGLLFPTLYTVVGALIGGIFAFLIAKRGFSDNALNKGKTYIHLLGRDAEMIAKNSIELLEIGDINSCKDVGIETLMGIWGYKVEKFDTQMKMFKVHWDTYKENIMSCSMKHVCRNKGKRKKYNEIISNMLDLYNEILICQGVLNQVQEKYRNLKENERKKYIESEMNEVLSYIRRLRAQCKEMRKNLDNEAALY